MTWDVYWLADPEKVLAHLYVHDPDPRTITEAADEVDRILEIDPVNAGESRPDGRRILFRLPLGVLYRVFQQQRKVEVSDLWKVPKPGA